MSKKPKLIAKKPQHVFLIDGSGFLFRAFYAIPSLTRGDGTPVNAVLGFTNMLWAMLRETTADHIAVIFDTAHKTFRNEIFPDYKANRETPPDELIPQFDIVREMVRAFNVAAIELPGFEADDLIASYTRIAINDGAKVTIVSSDKDLMQLVSDNKVVIFDHFKNQNIGEKGVIEKFGVSPEKGIDVQALAGDSSDNVPGIPGIGIKTAAQLINEYGDLDSLLSRANEIKQPKRRENIINHSQMALISRELVKLRDDVPIPEPLEKLSVQKINPDILLSFLKKQGFKSAIERISSQLNLNSDQVTPKEQHKTNYVLVQSISSLETWVARAKEAGVIAIDTETNSLDASRAKLVGISLALNIGEACYIPLSHISKDILDKTDTLKQINFDVALNMLRPILEDHSILKVGQNIKYDMLVLERHGIFLNSISDSMVMSFVLDGSLHGHGMDELSEIHLGHKTTTFKEITGSGKEKITFDLVALNPACQYAAEDADVTLQLFKKLTSLLIEQRLVTVYERLERPLINVLMNIERSGIKLDRAVLSRLSSDFSSSIKVLEKQIYKISGKKFNVGSPKQLGQVLFDDIGLTAGKIGKSGSRSTSADILETLSAEGHELPSLVLKWRQLTKLKSTYADALLEHINPDTNRVHTSFSMTTAGTGRLSSSNPNLQNIPIRTDEGRKIREAFVAEKDHLLLSADYSQIELRILAHIADVKSLKDAFEKIVDIHALTASQVFGIPVDNIDPDVRRSAKAINFGIIYGISPFGLARQLGISQKEAKKYINSYFEQYPGIRDYMDLTIEKARSDGFVSTLFGRKCFTPGINDKNPARRQFSERAAINAPIQGTAADIIKIAMIRLSKALNKSNSKAKIILQVHDELVIEIPTQELSQIEPFIRQVMENSVKLDVPLIVETGHGINWASAH